MFFIKGNIERCELLTEIEKAINGNELAAFIGAGLSILAGVCDWKELLEQPAKDIGLDANKEIDLVSLAQYYCNQKSRTSINELIRERFNKVEVPTENHILLSQLPISTFWTTNYDKLIEVALKKKVKDHFSHNRQIEILRSLSKHFHLTIC